MKKVLVSVAFRFYFSAKIKSIDKAMTDDRIRSLEH